MNLPRNGRCLAEKPAAGLGDEAAEAKVAPDLLAKL